jgi:hypothetical protein
LGLGQKKFFMNGSQEMIHLSKFAGFKDNNILDDKDYYHKKSSRIGSRTYFITNNNAYNCGIGNNCSINSDLSIRISP